MGKIEEQGPARQLSELMCRIYDFGLTTTSGGNLSIKDAQGVIWITPGGIDKSNLVPEDIIRMDPDGTVTGKHNPSIETAFHKGLYSVRSDVGAVVHAHAPASSAFCISRTAPDMKIIPQIYLECGDAVMTGYAAPGSDLLGEKLAAQAEKGFHTLLLDNHGSAAVGRDLLHAFQRFEALDVCSRSLIKANSIGIPKQTDEDAHRLLAAQLSYPLGSFTPEHAYTQQRKHLCNMARRAYMRGLMTSSLGSLSIRVSPDEFLITPFGGDRYALTPDDIVLVRKESTENGRQPDIWTALHRSIYDTHPAAASVMTAVPPAAMAYAVTDVDYDTRTLTEGYVLLRDIKRVDFSRALGDTASCAEELHKNQPVLLISHGGVLAMGASAIQVLDRIEVAEVSMRAGLWARHLGGMHSLGDKDIADIKTYFKLS